MSAIRPVPAPGATSAARRRPVVVAIDGPAASGKSSTALCVAERAGLRHVDSGALYRAATAAQLRLNTDTAQWTEASVLAAASIVSVVARATTFVPVLAGREAEDEIRGAGVTRSVSRVAQMPGVRRWVDETVRALATDHDLVVDGRDIGTVVFPDAEVKFFLTARPEVRAKRRHDELVAKGQTVTFEATLADVRQRDEQDTTRAVAPLKQAPDAMLVDSSDFGIDETVARMVARVREQSS
jgi:CMP/dCMP kinase